MRTLFTIRAVAKLCVAYGKYDENVNTIFGAF
jgi:hypothetical protein